MMSIVDSTMIEWATWILAQNARLDSNSSRSPHMPGTNAIEIINWPSGPRGYVIGNSPSARVREEMYTDRRAQMCVWCARNTVDPRSYVLCASCRDEHSEADISVMVS